MGYHLIDDNYFRYEHEYRHLVDTIGYTTGLVPEHQNGWVVSKYDNAAHYSRGKFHREDGPAILASSVVKFAQHGRLHREDGPAVMHRGGQSYWYLNGHLHCDCGPASYTSNDTKKKDLDDYDWFYHGNGVNDIMNEWCRECGIDITNITDEQRFLIKLKMAEFE